MPKTKTCEKGEIFGKMAKEEAKHRDNIDEDYYNFITDMRENRKRYHVSVSDVGRKKDL